MLQTRFPEHPLMQSLLRRSYRQIAEELLAERKMLGFPPRARVVMFRCDALELKQALEKLETIKAILLQTSRIGEISCIGPMPALMTRRIGRYRGQLCLLSTSYQALRAVLNQAMPQIQQVPSSAKISWSIDVDAYDL